MTVSKNWFAIPALLLIVLLALPAAADDRDLLRSRGAAPNVLLIVDSSGSMSRDVGSDSISFIGSGDDPHSKLYEVKYALGRFFDAYPNFNMGFTFYERDSIEVQHSLFLYRLDPALAPISWDWRIRIDDSGGLHAYGSTQSQYINSGDIVRFGDNNPLRGGGSYLFIPIFGPLGKSVHSDWSRYAEVRIAGSKVGHNSGTVHFNGVDYTGEYRVDAWLHEPITDAGYYFPAYDWTLPVSSGIDTFQLLHDTWGPTVFDPVASPEDRLAAFQTLVAGRAVLQSTLEAHQIGLENLTLNLRLRECQGTGAYIEDTDGTCHNGNWVTIDGESRIMTSAGGVTPWELDATDTTLGAYPPSIVPLDFDASGNHQSIDYGNACNGWQGVFQSATKIPLIPIPVDDDPDMMPYMNSFLRPQTQMQFFFPTRNTGIYNYWPHFWDDQPGGSIPGIDGKGIWVTDRVLFAAGSTPIKNSLNDSEQYFYQVILDREDPFAECRSNFIILLTDGLETCSGATTACVAATDLGNKNLPVFVIGYGLGTAGNNLECIADNSDGELYLPENVEQLVAALKNVGQSIEERSRGFAAPMVPSVEMMTGQKAFIANFLPLNGRSIWQGHLRAYPIDPVTGRIPTTAEGFLDISESLWDASEELISMGHAARYMYYGDEAAAGMPGTRQPFVYPATDIERDKLRNYMGNMGLTDTELGEIISFIRGDRDPSVYEGQILGDIFHGIPQLSGAPKCYPCWLMNLHSYRDDLSNPGYNDGFRATHEKRRNVLFSAADDGTLHAFDAGMWSVDDGKFDDGTGQEIFAWSPRAVMPTYELLTYGTDHFWTVDGTPTTADVFIDRDFVSTPDFDDRQWRSIVIFGERRGGRSYTCLDVTLPDPYDSGGIPSPHSPSEDRMAGCRNDGASCDGVWPAFRWEFTDTADENLDGAPDLGQTWSRPLVGFVEVQIGTGESATVEERSVAIFGGGFAHNGLSGRHLYILDIETGHILFKTETHGMVPGDVVAVDLNLNGFLERLYWGDTQGHLYRMDISTPGQIDIVTGRVTSWISEDFFWAGADQPFFQRPTVAPVAYASDGTPYFAIAIGAGNRDDIFELNPTPHEFYVVLDQNDFASVATLTTGNLHEVNMGDANTDVNYLSQVALRGWYLVLGEYEKVNTSSLILSQNIVFSTFRPGTEIIIVPDPDDPGGFLCRQSGDAKTYILSFFNGNGGTEDGSRYIQHSGETAIVSDPGFYLGADGAIHTYEETDDGRIIEPLAPELPSLRTVTWKEK